MIKSENKYNFSRTLRFVLRRLC